MLNGKMIPERYISMDAYEDSLNMQKASNAGYESKIKELENQIKLMYSEEEVISILQKYRFDLSSGKTAILGDTTKIWFKQFKKQ